MVGGLSHLALLETQLAVAVVNTLHVLRSKILLFLFSLCWTLVTHRDWGIWKGIQRLDRIVDRNALSLRKSRFQESEVLARPWPSISMVERKWIRFKCQDLEKGTFSTWHLLTFQIPLILKYSSIYSLL